MSSDGARGPELGSVRDGWIFAVELADPAELDGLMDAAGYEAFLADWSSRPRPTPEVERRRLVDRWSAGSAVTATNGRPVLLVVRCGARCARRRGRDRRDPSPAGRPPRRRGAPRGAGSEPRGARSWSTGRPPRSVATPTRRSSSTTSPCRRATARSSATVTASRCADAGSLERHLCEPRARRRRAPCRTATRSRWDGSTSRSTWGSDGAKAPGAEW